MELSIFLSQVIGVYLILIGLISITRRKMMMAAVADIAKNRSLIYVIAVLELLAGIALVISHNIWAWEAAVIITIVGWLMLIEAVCYLILPNRVVQGIFKRFNKNGWYLTCGLLAVVLGLYLAGVGFGWI
jgi:uncharacterized membrane protein